LLEFAVIFNTIQVFFCLLFWVTYMYFNDRDKFDECFSWRLHKFDAGAARGSKTGAQARYVPELPGATL
jgi:hypothetical protein